jgi:hypothetical protein
VARWEADYDGNGGAGMNDEDAQGVEFYNVAVVRETEKALLVQLDPQEYGGREEWIAKSQILERSDVKGGIDTGTLVITEWLAGQKGLAT